MSILMKLGIFFASLVVLSTLLFIVVYQRELPFWDQWSLFIGAPKLFAEGWGLQDLWAQHNEHRIFIPRIFHIFDLEFFSGRNEFFLWSMMLAQIFILIGIARFVLQEKILTQDAKIWLVIFTVILLFIGTQFDNFIWPFQIQFIFCNFFVVFALICYAKSVILQPAGLGYYWAAALFAGLAVLTSSQGLVVLCALLCLSVLTRETKYRMIGLLALTVLFTTVYLIGHANPDHHPSRLTALQDPIGLLYYCAVYLGAGLSRKIQLAALLGGVGMLLALYTFVIAWRKRWLREPLFILGTGLQLYVVGTMLITAIGRLGFGVGQAISGRYTSTSLLFWLGLVMIIFLRHAHEPLTIFLDNKKSRYVIGIGLFGIGYVVVSATLADMRYYIRQISMENQAIPAFEMGIYDEPVLKRVYPDAKLMWKQRDFMISHKLSIFSQAPTVVLGENFMSHYSITKNISCVPENLQVHAMSSDDKMQQIFRVDFVERLRVFPWQTVQILLTDKNHIIQGYGLPNVRIFFASKPKTEWLGYIKMPLDQKQFEIYRVNKGEKTACHVATYTVD